MFIFCRVLCFHSPYHKTRVICLTRDKQKRLPPVKCNPSTSCVPPVMTAVTVRNEDRAHGDYNNDYWGSVPLPGGQYMAILLISTGLYR